VKLTGLGQVSGNLTNYGGMKQWKMWNKTMNYFTSLKWNDEEYWIKQWKVSPVWNEISKDTMLPVLDESDIYHPYWMKRWIHGFIPHLSLFHSTLVISNLASLFHLLSFHSKLVISFIILSNTGGTLHIFSSNTGDIFNCFIQYFRWNEERYHQYWMKWRKISTVLDEIKKDITSIGWNKERYQQYWMK
jgi:hypothetical protein